MGGLSASAIVAEVEQRGGHMGAEGGRLWIEPGDVLDKRLRAEIRARKAELLALLSNAAPPLDGRCLDCSEPLGRDIRGHAIVAGLCAQCCAERRGEDVSPVLIRDAERVELPAHQSAPLCVVIERRSVPPPGPVRLDTCTVVVHPAKCIAASMSELASIGEAFGEPDLSPRDMERLNDDAAEILERLRMLGVQARLAVKQ